MQSNGPLKMYNTPQIVQHDFPVELPNCMYAMKNIHDSRRNGNVIKAPNHVSSASRNLDISEQIHEDIPGMADLVERQQKILKQLQNLRTQMLDIKKELNLSAESIPKPNLGTSNVLPSRVNDKIDLILNASISHPPHSLNLLARSLKDRLNFNVTVHVHSTVTNKEPISNFTIPQSTRQSGVPTINLRLIWKDVEAHTEMITPEGSHVIGEVNMLRYLARKLPLLNYENDTAVDSVLDTCHCIISAATKTERSTLLRLVKSKFDETKQLNVADFALYSVMKQIANNELGANLSKLLNQFDRL